MSEDTTTTTEETTVQADESSQPENVETQAVQEEDTSTTETTTTNEENSEETELKEWAEKKGLKTDDPLKLLKMVRESEQKMHTATVEANKLKESVSEASNDIGKSREEVLLARLQVADFYNTHRDASQYDAVMAEVVKEKPYLADDLEAVYEIAVARAYRSGVAIQSEAQRKEALARKAKAEIAAPPQASATTRETPKNITAEDIGSMSTQEYMDFKRDNPEFDPFKLMMNS
jgi:hypothetical protein